MTKSELIEILAQKQTQLAYKDVELAVKNMLEHMATTLANGERIEIRGFGSFSLHYRAPRTGRNPKTGDSVTLTGKYVPHFKPGKELRDRSRRGLSARGGSRGRHRACQFGLRAPKKTGKKPREDHGIGG